MENEVVNKVQPNDTLAEQAVLGSMLSDKEAVQTALETLGPEDFYREDNKEIFAAMQDIYTVGKEVDIITVGEQLKLRGTLERVGGTQNLATLIDNVPTTSNVARYVEIVKQKSLSRSIIKVNNDILKIAYDQTEDVDSILEQAEKNIFDIAQNRNTKDYAVMKDILITTLDNIEKMQNKKTRLSGMESGFYDLDEKLSGLNNSDLIIVAARPAMGKSAFVLNIATYVAMHNKVPVMIFNLEMSKEQLANRILSGEAEVDNKKIANGDLSPDEYVKVAEGMNRLAGTQLYIDDSSVLSPSEIRAKCRKAKLEKNIGLVIVDYLQLMEAKSPSGSRQQEISEISRGLKILAKELDVPVIALSQLSRATEARADHKPMLSDLRESGSIEQDADIVLFIHRDDYYDQESENKNMAEIIVAKNRHGETGTVKLGWEGKYTRFSNLAKGNTNLEGITEYDLR
ncbi:MAG: replicative DNA helicase [Clostridia bacterium]|nr:replicative DNA helicase [Clostridia bacterium]